MKSLLPILTTLYILFPSSGNSQDCITSECHSEINTNRYVHAPVENLDCLACHKYTKKKHPKGRGSEYPLITENISKICTECHDVDINASDLHNPVAEGMCTSCHDPHQSSVPDLLAGPTPGFVCSRCHETGNKDKDYTHGPVAVKACSVCHTSHGKVTNALLREKDVNTVCYGCHELKEEEINSVDNIHEPVRESCSKCHNPHESDYKFQLSDNVPDLCLDCHTDIQEIVAGAKSHHQALQEEKTCLNCHAPHGSNYSSNLNQDAFTLCLSCHDKPMDNGKLKIPSMKKFLDENPNWHGPIREKNCSGCHNPHGSENIRLLLNAYPPNFYIEFDEENYQLCFQCHSPENVLFANTSKMTNFRIDKQNLHFLHVNREKGRTCRACHQTHASENPNHIRATVPFGGWELPINFVENTDGGTCTPGCHKTKTYKR